MNELTDGQRQRLDQLADAYQYTHGAAIETIKQGVGSGIEYFNSVARAVVSDNGAWCECIDLPLEFSGSSGAPAEVRFIRDDKAIELIEQLHGLASGPEPVGTRLLDLLCLYTPLGISDSKGVAAVHFEEGASAQVHQPSRVVIGSLRPGVLPLFFRFRIESTSIQHGLTFARGSLFCLSGLGERCLLVLMPHEGEEAFDLGVQPLSRAAN